MSQENVTGIRGQFVPAAGQPVPEVVEYLERLLADAQAGHLHAIAGACDYTDGVRYASIGRAVGFDMIGGLEMAKAGLVKAILPGGG